MRMFLVGMCDIFLILYLTTLNQVNPFNNSYLTVDDYNKLKESKIQAEHDSEISNAQILELRNSISALDKEKEQTLQLILTAKAETEKALQLANIEKEKTAQTEIALSKTISKKEELGKLIQKSQENEQNALKIAKEMQAESEKARENEQDAMKTAEELRLKAEEARKNEEEMRRIAEEARLKAEEAVRNEEVARRIAVEERLKAEKAIENETVALKMAENAENLKEIALKNEAKARNAEAKTISKKEELGKLIQKSQENEQNALKIVKEIQVKVEEAEENEQDAMKTAEELRLKAEEARKNEEEMRRIAEDARLKAEEALRNEEVARRIAKEERLKAEKAMENEEIAIKLAEDAERQKKIALKNEARARMAEAKAIKVASIAKSEATEVKSKIKSITQTSDRAYDENILDKLTQFTITVDYENRSKQLENKEFALRGLPVKMGGEHVLFVLSEWIDLYSTLTPEDYVSYSITVNGEPVTKLYIRPGEAGIAALAINGDGLKSCLPVGKANDFSSYMPVLFSIRSQMKLGVMDRIRGISRDYYIFKRDHLLMITEDEFYFDNEGFRGTGNYAEYIVKGDQIVDLEGKFIGFAYKKNKILRIAGLKGWREVSINGGALQKLSKQIRGE